LVIPLLLEKAIYSDPNDAGEVSHFQALATALSGTVLVLVNIAGSRVAFLMVVPGATLLDAFLAGPYGHGIRNFTECYQLGVKYRNEYKGGSRGLAVQCITFS